MPKTPTISTSKIRRKKKKKRTRTDLLLLGLGSNLGPGQAILRWAITELERFLAPALTDSLRPASLYRSVPISPIEQPDFLNTALLGQLRSSAAGNALGPEELLAFVKALEFEAGRRRGPRLGPRVLDIDLLAYGEQRRARPELTLPHPRLHDRAFVLAPLADLCPNWLVPGLGKGEAVTVRERLALLAPQEVEEVGWASCPGS